MNPDTIPDDSRPRRSAPISHLAAAQVGRSALRRVLDTFYEGSLEKAVAALLHGADGSLSPDELQRLGKLIQQARKAGR